jgi:hypothetical protein
MSDVSSEFNAEGGPSDGVELVLPTGTVIDFLVNGPEMSQFMDQRLEAVALRVAADKNSLAIVQRHSAHSTAKYLLDYGFANHVDSPAIGHRVGPDA